MFRSQWQENMKCSAHLVHEARVTQISQHALFRGGRVVSIRPNETRPAEWFQAAPRNRRQIFIVDPFLPTGQIPEF